MKKGIVTVVLAALIVMPFTVGAETAKEKALKALPAAGCEKVIRIEAIDEEDSDCDWSEFEEYDEMADIKMLSEGISDEEIENTQHIKLVNKIEPAAGSLQEKDDLYVEANDCNWSEFESL